MIAIVMYENERENWDGEMTPYTSVEGVIVSKSDENYTDFVFRCNEYCKDRRGYYWEDADEL